MKEIRNKKQLYDTKVKAASRRRVLQDRASSNIVRNQRMETRNRLTDRRLQDRNRKGKSHDEKRFHRQVLIITRELAPATRR